MNHTIACPYPEGCSCGATYVNQLEAENDYLKKVLGEISTTAHCLAKAGPLHTSTLDKAWSQFMKLDAMAACRRASLVRLMV